MNNWHAISELASVELIAEGHGIRELQRLRRIYSGTNWKKKKAFATIRFESGDVRYAELHWYEAHGVGKREMKIKTLLD